MKQISILLTKYSDWISTLVYYIGGRGYTHSSIALEEDPNRYYSFNYRGFAVETLEKHRRRGVKRSLCFQLQVPDEAYSRLSKRIHTFQTHKAELRYTRIGVFCCLLHLPMHWKKHYFCSQFVAELLQSSGVIARKKDAALYLPNHFPAELERHPGCSQILYQVI